MYTKPVLTVALVLVLLLSLSGKSSAQTKDYIGFRNPTFQLGINGNQIDNDNVAGYNQAGLLTGLSFQFGVSRVSAIQMEVLYSRKGSRVTDDQVIDHGLMFYQFKLDYASIPLLYHFSYQQKASLFFGPSINALIGARKEVGNFDEVDALDDFQPVDLCGEFGLEFFILENLSATGRFIYSLSAMNKIQLPIEAGGRSAAYNNSLSFRLVYYFKRYIPKSNQNAARI